MTCIVPLKVYSSAFGAGNSCSGQRQEAALTYKCLGSIRIESHLDSRSTGCHLSYMLQLATTMSRSGHANVFVGDCRYRHHGLLAMLKIAEENLCVSTLVSGVLYCKVWWRGLW